MRPWPRGASATPAGSGSVSMAPCTSPSPGPAALARASGGFVLGHGAAYITNNSILSDAGQVVKVAI